MGNSNSNQRKSEPESGIKISRIPKHLQPLKRKQTKKSSNSSSATTTTTTTIKATSATDITEPPVSCHPRFIFHKENKDNKAISNPAKTLQTHCVNGEGSDHNIIVDHSASSPQLGKKQKDGPLVKVDYVEENTKYLPLPNTRTELDRQRVQLYIMRWAFESRHIVPPIIKQKLFEGIRVLDVSCGPGLWLGHPVMDMAEDFCKSSFDAVNICSLLPPKEEVINYPYQFTTNKSTKSNIEEEEQQQQQKSEKLTENFTFTAHDMVKDGPLPFEENTFDYVQQAQAVLVYNHSDWKRVLLDIKRVTKPGGYVQLLEIDLYPQPLGKIGGLWRDQLHQAIQDKTNIPTRIPCHLDKVLEEAGLIDICTRFVTIPAGSWGLDIGVLWEQNVYGFMEEFKPYLMEVMQMTDDQYEEKRTAFQDELKDGVIKPFNNVYIAWGKIQGD